MQVKINFLPVGHTHEDIDQMFSRISDSIRKTGCESIQGYCETYCTYCVSFYVHTCILHGKFMGAFLHSFHVRLQSIKSCVSLATYV